MAVAVDHEQARKLLNRAWASIQTCPPPPPNIAVPIERICSSTDVTFKYILVTGLLGKCANPKVHPRALQTSSVLKGAYDARSLCHKVIVPFEKTKGDLWGLSNEPFVNKPARHPEHSQDNPQLRNKVLAETLHNVLESANRGKPGKVFAMLVHALRAGKQRADTRIVASVEIETTFRRVVDFVELFLQQSDGGTRLVAVAGAFISLLNQGFTVKVYSPNASDRFGKTTGDIEVFHDSRVICAYECKDRPLSLDDVHHGLRKASDHGISEYSFVIASGIVAGQEDEVRQAIQSCQLLDLHLFEIHDVAQGWAAGLNPVRRKNFGNCVSKLLRESMKRAEVANRSAELWNNLK